MGQYPYLFSLWTMLLTGTNRSLFIAPSTRRTFTKIWSGRCCIQRIQSGGGVAYKYSLVHCTWTVINKYCISWNALILVHAYCIWNKNSTDYRSLSWRAVFYPVGLETLGAFGRLASQLFEMIARHIEALSGVGAGQIHGRNITVDIITE